MKKVYAILRREMPEFVDGQWRKRPDETMVRIMAEAEGYAMVRCKGAIPFVVHQSSLRRLPAGAKPWPRAEKMIREEIQ